MKDIIFKDIEQRLEIEPFDHQLACYFEFLREQLPPCIIH